MSEEYIDDDYEISVECEHELDEEGICMKCACRPIDLAMDSEIKYYNKSNNIKKGTSRCQIRKTHIKTLSEDLSNTGLPNEILEKIDDMYHDVVGEKVYRGQIRLAIALILIKNYYIYILNKPIDPDGLADRLGVIKSKITIGRKIYANFIRNNPQLKNRPKYTTPMSLIPDILKKLDISLDSLSKIEKIYNKISGAVGLSSSKPQSLAVAIVYYYLSTLDENSSNSLVKKDYCESVGVSEITVTKIFKDIQTLMKKIQN